MFHLRFILLSLLLSGVLFAQEEVNLSVRPDRVKQPKVTYKPVAENKLQVVVIDSAGPVGGLAEEDFEIRTELREGEVYDVKPLMDTETAKVSMVMCIDNSSSMAKHVGLLKETLNTLLYSLGPSVKISTVFFMEDFAGHRGFPFDVPSNIRIYEFTKDKEVIKNAFEDRLGKSRLTTRTFLYDAVYSAIKMMTLVEDPEDQKYVVVFSDGKDLGSSYNEEHVYTLAQIHDDLAFYTIDFLQETNPFLLNLAQESNGRHFEARKAEELAAIFEQISEDIEKLTGYLVTYDLRLGYLAGCIRDALTCEPIPQANLTLHPTDKPHLIFSVASDENGAYKSRVAFPYKWAVHASAPDYMADSAFVNVDEENVFVTDLQLYPAYVSKRGRVLDAGTAPLPDAQVTVTELNSGDVLFHGLTDSLGGYGFESRVGHDLLISATKDGYTFGSVDVPEISRDAAIPDIVLGLTAEGVVSEFRFLFEFDSDKLDLEDISTLSQLKGCIEFINRELEKSETRTVRLVGWTDSVGTAEYNLDLSNRRATYVKNYLVEQAIPAQRIEAIGKGISSKYDNATEEGRALNRRTDVVFFDRASEAEEVTEKN